MRLSYIIHNSISSSTVLSVMCWMDVGILSERLDLIVTVAGSLVLLKRLWGVNWWQSEAVNLFIDRAVSQYDAHLWKQSLK